MRSNLSFCRSYARLARLSLLSLLCCSLPSLATNHIAAENPLELTGLVPNDPLAGIGTALPQTREKSFIDALATTIPPSSLRMQRLMRDTGNPILLEEQANLFINIVDFDQSDPDSVIPPTSTAGCRWLRSSELLIWLCSPQFPYKKDLAVVSYRYMFDFDSDSIPNSFLDNWIQVLRATGFRRIVIQIVFGGWNRGGRTLREWPDAAGLISIPATFRFLPANFDTSPAPVFPAIAPLPFASIFPGQSSAAPALESDADLILDMSFPRIPAYSSWSQLRDSEFNITIRHPLTSISGDIDGPYFLRLRLGAINFPHRDLAIVVLPPDIRPTPDEISFVIDTLRDAGFARISIQRQIESSRLILLDVR